MTDSRDGSSRWLAGPAAAAAGVHFGVLQTAWFLLLEASLSARALTWFVASLFWLLGLLVGLYLPRRWRLWVLLGAGIGGWYVALASFRVWPYSSALYAVAAAGALLSGMAPGFLFAVIGRRWQELRRALLHENNGFVVGLFVALKGALYFESHLLTYGPAVTGALAVILWALTEPSQGSRKSPSCTPFGS